MVQEVDLFDLCLDDLLFSKDVPQVKLPVLRADDVHIPQVQIFFPVLFNDIGAGFAHLTD